MDDPVDAFIHAICGVMNDGCKEGVHMWQLTKGAEPIGDAMHLIAQVEKGFEGIPQLVALELVDGRLNSLGGYRWLCWWWL